MAILQEATFGGVQAADGRPGAFIKETTLQAIAKGQAWAYEATTGQKVPNAGSISATPHVHDGTDGALMRLPLFTAWLGASLPGVPANASTVTPGWGRFVYVPVPVPDGVTEVSLVLVGEGVHVPETVRATLLSSSLVENEEPVPVELLERGHHFDTYTERRAFHCRLQANAGEVNVLRVEAWAGKSLPSAADDDNGPYLEQFARVIDSVHLLPVDQPPAVVTPAQYPATTSDALSSSDADFVSFDDAEVQNDCALNPYLLKEMNANTGRLHELITGRARGLESEGNRLFVGHNHADDGASDLDDSGAGIFHNVGSWFYGVVRGISAADTNRPNFDEVAATPTSSGSWSGNIIAPVLTAVSSAETCAVHNLRLPSLKSSNLTGTSKLKYAVLLWKDDTDSTTVAVQMSDADGGSSDAATSSATTSAGRSLITGEVDAEVDGLATSTQDGLLAAVELVVQNSKAAANNVAVYGLCLWLEG